MSEGVIEGHDGSKSQLGFWLYLMTDCILFATLFAAFVVLRNSTNGGPDGQELFQMPFVLMETVLLLTSSFTSGLALLAAGRKDKALTSMWLIVTMILGAAFLGMELFEFRELIADGHSWRVSAFLSAFFTLVGTHGAHIFVGLLWASFLLFTLRKNGFSLVVQRRLKLFSVFWHFLDVIWIFIFSVVYLLGVQ